MHLDPEIIRQQIANLLVSCPELAEDEILRADMIEGETEAFDFLSMIVRKIGETKALAAGTDEYVKELRERSARLDRRVEGLRTLATRIMDTAQIKKAELPEATLSLRNVPPKLVVDDPENLPDIACKFVRKPDMDKIKELWTAEPFIAGVHMDNGGQSLTIRTK
jgi:hypothetical protein